MVMFVYLCLKDWITNTCSRVFLVLLDKLDIITLLCM